MCFMITNLKSDKVININYVFFFSSPGAHVHRRRLSLATVTVHDSGSGAVLTLAHVHLSRQICKSTATASVRWLVGGASSHQQPLRQL